MNSNNRYLHRNLSGFTLIELMVGLTIGMLVTIVITQVFSVFEAQKRVTTGSADAQTNGSIALFNMDRELRMAGYPLVPVSNSPLECATLTYDGVVDNAMRLSPAILTDGGTGSDTVTIRYGNSAMGGIPTQITTALPTVTVQPPPVPAFANDVVVSNNYGCNNQDKVLFTNGTACAISSVPASSVTGTTTLTFADATAAATAVTAATAVRDANLACLGTWNEIVYAAINANLQRAGVDSVAGIVSIQAQYGISATPGSNQVIQWVNAKNLADWSVAVDGANTGVDWGTGLTVPNRNRIKAIRIAVVARNPKMEQSAVTSQCSSTTLAAPTGLCAWDATSALPIPLVAPFVASPAPAIDLSAADPNWLRYRYRVFETIIPLRNMIWSRGTL